MTSGLVGWLPAQPVVGGQPGSGGGGRWSSTERRTLQLLRSLNRLRAKAGGTWKCGFRLHLSGGGWHEPTCPPAGTPASCRDPQLLQGPPTPAGKLTTRRARCGSPTPRPLKQTWKRLRDQCVYSQQHFRKRANTACPHTGDLQQRPSLRLQAREEGRPAPQEKGRPRPPTPTPGSPPAHRTEGQRGRRASGLRGRGSWSPGRAARGGQLGTGPHSSHRVRRRSRADPELPTCCLILLFWQKRKTATTNPQNRKRNSVKKTRETSGSGSETETEARPQPSGPASGTRGHCWPRRGQLS